MLSFDDVIPLSVATVVYPAMHPLAGQTGIVNAYALRHPQGLVLVDTGVGEGDPWIDEHYGPTRRPLATALAAHGLAVADVSVLVNTHLHFDHCGGNRLFARVPIFVQAAEYAAAQQPGFTVPAWVDFAGAVYRQLDGEAEVLPGVRVVPTPGHTPGHQSVLVETAEGVVILAGQAVQSLAEWEHLQKAGALPAGGAPADAQAYQASARRLLSLEPRRVYLSHDEAVWERGATHA